MIKDRDLTKVFTILIVVSVILNFCFVLVSFNHDCTHEDNCPVCTLIHNIKNDLSGFNPNLLRIVIAMILLFSPIAIYLSNRIINKKKDTLVGLKVELIN